LSQLNEQLRVAVKAEGEARTRLTAVTKENERMRRDSVETTTTLHEMETLNKELRHELQRATQLAKKTMQQRQHGGSVNNEQHAMAVELLNAQNRRLKDQLDEVLSLSHPNAIVYSSPRASEVASTSRAADESYRHTAPPSFVHELEALHARRLRAKARMHDDSITELESDYEPIVYRPRRRRQLKRAHRRQRSQVRHQYPQLTLTFRRVSRAPSSG